MSTRERQIGLMLKQARECVESRPPVPSHMAACPVRTLHTAALRRGAGMVQDARRLVELVLLAAEGCYDISLHVATVCKHTHVHKGLAEAVPTYKQGPAAANSLVYCEHCTTAGYPGKTSTFRARQAPLSVC